MEKPRIAEPSVKSLYLEMFFNETKLASGTGFVAWTKRGAMLITNRHNVTGRDQNTGQPLDAKTGGIPNKISVHHHKLGSLGQVFPSTENLYDEEIPRWIEHPTHGPRADFVAVPLSEIRDRHIFAYNPAKPGLPIKLSVTDVVSVIGFPFGLRSGGILPVWATGFIATEPQIDHENLPIMLIDCRSRRGQSGSAVVAFRSGGMIDTEDGSTGLYNSPVYRFIGIYSGRINAESDLGIVWKSSAIAELIDSIV